MLFTSALTIIRQRRHVLATAISAALYTLAWAPAAGAQTDAEPIAGQPLSAQDCALIRDGLQRLACFDEVYQPDLARDNASTEQRQRIESATEALPPIKRNIKGGLNSPGADDETAVMSSILDRYLEAEEALFSFSGSFIRHRPNYILPVTWSDHPNQAPTSPRLGVTGYDYDLKQEEAKYQISFKVPLFTGLMDKRTTLWFGYTQKSFWQLYNQDESAPFRETNYEPELFLRYQPDWNIGPGRLDTLYVGINHQSNGQAEPRSRSWNRIVGMGTYTYKRWLFMVKPWIRLPEGSTDDNNDIESYLGHGSYHAVYKLTEDRTFSLKLLNNLRISDNRTSVEFGYSFPIGEAIKGFVHYYNGYGESLIDYNERIQRIGVGIMLNDWL
jgi:phospholipase A1